MKKVSLLSVCTLALFGLNGCQEPAKTGSESTAQQNSTNTAQTDGQSSTATQGADLTIRTAKGEEKIEKNPSPIAVYDMTVLQNLAALGVPVNGMPLAEMNAERVAFLNLKAEGTPDSTSVGTLFEPDLEALNALKPKAVFVGSRMADKSEALAQVAPVYNLSIDTNNVYESSKAQLADLGKVFDKEALAQERQAEIDAKIEAVKVAVKDKGNGLAILINGNKMSAYGKNSRYGYLHTTFGIPMADENIEEARHGQPITFEYIQKTDPDWLFVLDRSAAIGEEGAAAKSVLDNPLVHNTKAWKNQQIVYLSPDSYLAFGGYYQWMKDTTLIIDAFNKKSSPQ